MKIGFIGAGNMATAMIQGMLAGGIAPGDIMAFDLLTERVEAMRALGVSPAASAVDLANQCDITILAVKPKHTKAVLDDLAANARVRALLSIVVGWSQAMLSAALPGVPEIAHAMPNTPALVQEGVIAINENHTMAPARFAGLREMLSACARVMVMPETLFDAVTAISGSGPAYAYMFIEALADGGVRQGLPRDIAYTLAAQTLLGAAKMVLETGMHPGALKDAVASPGGTTIEAIYALEKAGLRGAVMDAVDACAKKIATIAKQ